MVKLGKNHSVLFGLRFKEIGAKMSPFVVFKSMRPVTEAMMWHKALRGLFRVKFWIVPPKMRSFFRSF